MITYKYLNSETLKEDANGQRYSIETIGSAEIIVICPLVNPDVPIVTVVPQPTAQELYDNQLTLMNVMATMYEDMIAKGTV